MNQEHGIDDILTLLKESVNDENWNKTTVQEADLDQSAESIISVEDLKQKLQLEYMEASNLPLKSSEDIEEDESLLLIADTDDAEEVEVSSTELSDLLRNYEKEQSEDLLSYNHAKNTHNLAAIGKITPSVFDLMLQCGCEEELESMTEADTPSDVSDDEENRESYVLEREEEHHSEFLNQIEDVRRNFNKQKIYGALRLLCLAFLSVRLFLYELMPLLGISKSGIADFRQYPGSYIFLGLQLLMFCVLFSWKKLVDGVKRIFINSPNVYSVLCVIIFGISLYDIMMVFVPLSTLPPMFHFSVAVLLLYAAIAEYYLLWRNERVLSLYSDFFDRDDISKYTLSKSEGQYSLAEKIYQGGVDYSKNIYIPEKLDYPYGFENFFGSVRFESSWIKWLLPISVSLCVISVAFSTLLNLGWRETALTSLSVLFAILPLSALTSITASLMVSSKRLSRRGIALTSEEIIEQYAKADMMVFSDFHLLQACSAKDTGIYFYDKDQCALLLSCLKRVYSVIGSPLVAVFSDLPDLCEIHSVQILRITQGEMEVLIDKKHVLLLGDWDFMQRCGANFPVDRTAKDHASIYVSLDGQVSAKLSVSYRIEPIFEMLTERLAKEGVHSVVETYDPMICADLIAMIRSGGTSPISVVHKNASDLIRVGQKKTRERESVGILAYSSRLKLAEAMVWCKRLRKSQRVANWGALVFSVIGLTVVGLGVGFGFISEFNQYWLLLYVLLSNIAVLILSLATLPRPDYFTKDAFYRDIQNNQKFHKSLIWKRKKKKDL